MTSFLWRRYNYLMAKLITQYVCQQCGRTSPRPLGKCPQCGGWAVNTKARINIPFGATLTKLAELPQGAKRDRKSVV